jgi:hypothetical protein
MTLLPDLSHDLVAVAQRKARHHVAVRRRVRVAGLTLGGALALGGVVATAATIWTPQLGDDHRGHPVASASAPPVEQLARLGVLRRAATDADHGAESAYALRLMDPDLQGIRTGYVRLLGTQQDGKGYVLVPVASYGSRDHTGAATPDALCLFSRDVDGGGLSCFTTRQVLEGRAEAAMGPPTGVEPVGPVVTTPNGSRFRRTRSTVTAAGMRFFGLVPDGVAAVRLANDQGAALATVHDNFFQAPIPTDAAHAGEPLKPGDLPTYEWLDAAGNVVAPAASGGDSG